jgi:Phage tail lysozyme
MAAMDVGAHVFGYFRERGLSPQAAAGIVGNARQESSLNPNAPGGGLIQGQGGRTSSGTLRQQLDGIYHELTTSERGTLQALRGAKTPAEAALIFSQRFERPGVPMNSNRVKYAEEALRSYGHLTGVPGGGETSSPPPAGGTGEQQAAPNTQELQEVLAQVKALSGPSVLAAGVSPARPSFSAGPTMPEGAKTPAPIQPVQSPQSALLPLIEQAITAAGTASSSSAPAGAPGQQSATEVASGSSHYVNPLPGFTKGRTDMGVDLSAKPGAPIKAIGNAKILGIYSDWYKSQPYVSYELQDGPQKGKVVYVAEQITPTVKAGQTVSAGQQIGVYAPTGTGIETGYGTKGWQTQAQASGNTGDSTHGNSPAGIQFQRLLESLGVR